MSAFSSGVSAGTVVDIGFGFVAGWEAGEFAAAFGGVDSGVAPSEMRRQANIAADHSTCRQGRDRIDDRFIKAL